MFSLCTATTMHIPFFAPSASVSSSYLGNEDLSLSKYSPRAFWIFPRRSASLSRDLCTPWMFSTSITNGDFVTFFISAKNSVLMLWNKKEKHITLDYRRKYCFTAINNTKNVIIKKVKLTEKVCFVKIKSTNKSPPGYLWNLWVSTGSRCLMSALPVKMPSR